jgi:hypothetical protein
LASTSSCMPLISTSRHSVVCSIFVACWCNIQRSLHYNNSIIPIPLMTPVVTC